jgi:hypothetical protein
MGDAPESVAGVRSLGILHSPGYPTYVLSARAFGTLVPVGDWALRVNLFSLVCAVITIVAVYFVARLFRAGVGGALVGALALATAASFWFNATFAKHYALSAALVSIALLLALLWQRTGRSALLVGAAVVIGVATGTAVEQAVIMLVGIVVLVGVGPPRPTKGAMLAAAGAAFGGALVVWGFLVVRAQQHPALDWGEVDSLGRFLDLVRHREYTGAGAETNIVIRTVSYPASITRDLGLGAIVLAAIGGWAAVHRLDRGRQWFLLVVGGITFVGAVVGTGLSRPSGFVTAIVAGGYVIDLLLVLAILIACGTTFVASAVSEWYARRRPDSPIHVVATAVTVVVALAVLVPSIVTHHSRADNDVPAFADHYGEEVLDGLPPNAALLVWGEEFMMPMVYRQVVAGERRDVSVMAVNAVMDGWVSDQLARKYDLVSARGEDAAELRILGMINELRGRGQAVYLDLNAMYALSDVVAFRTNGFTGEVIEGVDETDVGPHATDAADEIARYLHERDRPSMFDDRYRRGSYANAFGLHRRAHIALARAYAAADDIDAAIDEVEAGLRLAPDPATRDVVERLHSMSPEDAKATILDL